MTASARRETARAITRFALGLAAMVALAALIGWVFRADVSRFGNWFVDHFGAAGIAFGTFLADGFHFPVPPQFYLFTGIAAGRRDAGVVLSVLLGSELGGLTAFSLARLLGRTPFVARRLEAPKALLDKMMRRRGYVGLATATLLPVSFSILCLASGAMRLPYKAYGVLATMRVPRILLSYAIIVLAWHA